MSAVRWKYQSLCCSKTFHRRFNCHLFAFILGRLWGGFGDHVCFWLCARGHEGCVGGCLLPEFERLSPCLSLSQRWRCRHPLGFFAEKWGTFFFLFFLIEKKTLLPKSQVEKSFPARRGDSDASPSRGKQTESLTSQEMNRNGGPRSDLIKGKQSRKENTYSEEKAKCLHSKYM